MDAARPARPEDLDAVLALARQAIAELSKLRGGEVWRLRTARREPLDAALLGAIEARAGASAEGTAVVGTIDEAVVGYGISRIECLADESLLAVVTDLYVEPEARGVGVGEGILDLLVDHATALGAIGIDSLALPGDRSTKNFFEAFGLKARAIVVHRALGGPS
ncbi:MAG: GNAT family N-acetyltransferase [Acidimicrobiales bacterium]